MTKVWIVYYCEPYDCRIVTWVASSLEKAEERRQELMKESEWNGIDAYYTIQEWWVDGGMYVERTP